MTIAPGQTRFRNVSLTDVSRSRNGIVAATDGSRFRHEYRGRWFLSFHSSVSIQWLGFNFSADPRGLPTNSADNTAVLLVPIMELTDELLSGDGVERLTFIPRYPTAIVVRLTPGPEAISLWAIVWPLTRVSTKSISRAGKFDFASQSEHVRRRQSRLSALLQAVATQWCRPQQSTKFRANR